MDDEVLMKYDEASNSYQNDQCKCVLLPHLADDGISIESWDIVPCEDHEMPKEWKDFNGVTDIWDELDEWNS